MWCGDAVCIYAEALGLNQLKAHASTYTTPLSGGKKVLLGTVGAVGAGVAGVIYALNESVKAGDIELHPAKLPIRRGYEVHKQVCAACHSLKYIAYRNLVGLSHTEAEAKAEAESILLLPFGNLDVISAASDEQFQDRIVVIPSDVTGTVNCADAQCSPMPETVLCDNDNRGHVFTGYSVTPTGMTTAHIDGIKTFGQGFDASGQDSSSSFTMLKRVFFFVQILLLPFENLDVISEASDEQFQDRIVVIPSDVTGTVMC
ncbi:hypothetical protein ISCGN_000026 [Ixodes scapularis]